MAGELMLASKKRAWHLGRRKSCSREARHTPGWPENSTVRESARDPVSQYLSPTENGNREETDRLASQNQTVNVNHACATEVLHGMLQFTSGV